MVGGEYNGAVVCACVAGRGGGWIWVVFCAGSVWEVGYWLMIVDVWCSDLCEGGLFRDGFLFVVGFTV